MVYVDVNGVGYEVQISLNTYSKIQNLEKGILQTCLLIREDAHILYGFFDKAEKEMFLQFNFCFRYWCNNCRMMLSYMKPDELSKSNRTKVIFMTLERIKGIGKKTAERLVLELKDKLAKQPFDLNISPLKHNTLHQMR